MADQLPRLTTLERIFAWRVAEGRYIKDKEMETAFYANREDGGPEYANHAVRICALKLKAKFNKAGIDLHLRKYFGRYVEREHLDRLRDLLVEELKTYANKPFTSVRRYRDGHETVVRHRPPTPYPTQLSNASDERHVSAEVALHET